MNTTFFNQKFTTKNQSIFLSILEEKKVELTIKREDKIHPFVSGNKFRKLKYNILEANKQQKKTLLTFGGAFSNHIVATAVAGNMAGFKTIGIIRGDELGRNLKKTLLKNETLKEATKNGMQLVFISRAEYKEKATKKFIEKIKNRFGDFYLIPEGGTNNLAIKGCEEILTENDKNFDYICSAIGTGGTIAGLINSARNHQKITGFPALKGDFLTKEIQSFIQNNIVWNLQNEYHFGGYGKYHLKLIHFINQFKKETNIPLDPIYTGKMLFGILDMITKNKFPKYTKILAIHTGGLQGVKGFNQKLKNKNQELISVLCNKNQF